MDIVVSCLFIFGLMYGFLFSAIIFLLFVGLETLFEKIYYKKTNLKYEAKEKSQHFGKYLFKIWITLSIAWIIIATFVTAYPRIKIESQPWDRVNYVTHDIVNLADNNEINGLFRGRYVRGYINEKTVYHYYYKTNDGGMKLQTANENITTIYMGDTSRPRAEWYRNTRSYWGYEEETHSCKIYVPEGTISTEFTVDME